MRAAVVPLGGSAVDVSAQRIILRLRGPRVRDVLAKGCAIDLHPRVFGRGCSAQTTLGRAGVVLLALCDAGDDYLVFVRSSFAGLPGRLAARRRRWSSPSERTRRPARVTAARQMHRADRALEAQDVLTGEVVGAVGLPGGDGAQQRHVLRDDVHVHVDSRSRNMQWMRVARLS